jgi:hypothetical protein
MNRRRLNRQMMRASIYNLDHGFGSSAFPGDDE